MSGSFDGKPTDPTGKDLSKGPDKGLDKSPGKSSDTKPAAKADRSKDGPDAEPAASLEAELAEVEAMLSLPIETSDPQTGAATGRSTARATQPIRITTPPLTMVETAFLASTASLLWLVSYYLSIGPWMRILFPIPIALVYLRWGNRAAWMSAVTTGLLLSVLMGPYLSILFCVPYALLGVQLGFMWKRGSPWFPSIGIGMLISTFGFFFRMALLSVFLGEDLWAYLINRIADLVQWLLAKLVDWGWLGLDALGQTNLTVVQIVAVLVVLCSDLVYLFTVHLAAWLLLERLGNPIPDPPQWVQVLLEEER